jgi:hypothetical protein
LIIIFSHWLKEIKGSLEDNVSLNDNYDGDALFINSDSIYSDNIKIAILKYDDL